MTSTQTLARNALTGAGRYAIGAVIALIVTPYALHQLGPARFGVWALAGAVVAVIRLVDLGLNRALTYRIALASGRGHTGDARAAVATGRSLALGLGLGAVGVVALAHRLLIDHVFQIPAAFRAEAVYVVVGTAVVAAVEGVFAPFQAALDGVGRMDLSNAVDTAVQRVFSPLGVVAVLALGWGLPGLVWKNLAAALVAGLGYAWLLRRAAPDLARAKVGWDKPEAAAMLAYGRHVQTVSLASALIEPVAKTLLSRSAGLGAVALFELAARVAGQMSGVFMAASTALFPAVARRQVEAEDDGEAGAPAIGTLYRTAARYNAWLVLPAYAIFVALAGPFVHTWLGPGYGDLVDALRILGLGWAVALLGLPAFHVAQAGGHARLSTIGGLVTGAVSMAAVVALIGSRGLIGVIGGLALGLAAGGVVVLALFARAIGLGRAAWGFAHPRVLLAALAGAAAAGWLAGRLPDGWASLGAAAMAGLAIYAAAMVASGEVGPADRERLRRLAGWSADRARHR